MKRYIDEIDEHDLIFCNCRECRRYREKEKIKFYKKQKSYQNGGDKQHNKKGV